MDTLNNKEKIGGAHEIWSTAWTYIRTVIDTMREPFLILDRDLRVVAVNSCFLRTFGVSDTATEGKLIYELGDGQWNIPRLKNLLEDILPKDTFFKDFEVDHEFLGIGRRIMILNARQIFHVDESPSEPYPPLILLAMEDATDRRLVAEKLAEYAQKIETNLGTRMQALDARVDELTNLHKIITTKDAQLAELKEEIIELKKKLQ